MWFTVIGVLVILAFLMAAAALAKKCPLEAPVFVLALVELLRLLPLGR